MVDVGKPNDGIVQKSDGPEIKLALAERGQSTQDVTKLSEYRDGNLAFDKDKHKVYFKQEEDGSAKLAYHKDRDKVLVIQGKVLEPGPIAKDGAAISMDLKQALINDGGNKISWNVADDKSIKVNVSAAGKTNDFVIAAAEHPGWNTKMNEIANSNFVLSWKTQADGKPNFELFTQAEYLKKNVGGMMKELNPLIS